MNRRFVITISVQFGLLVVLMVAMAMCAKWCYQRGEIVSIMPEIASYGMDSWRYPPTEEQLAERERCFTMWTNDAMRQRDDWRKVSWKLCLLELIPAIFVILISASVYTRIKESSNKAQESSV
jgi:hypothetical protein